MPWRAMPRRPASEPSRVFCGSLTGRRAGSRQERQRLLTLLMCLTLTENLGGPSLSGPSLSGGAFTPARPRWKLPRHTRTQPSTRQPSVCKRACRVRVRGAEEGRGRKGERRGGVHPLGHKLPEHTLRSGVTASREAAGRGKGTGDGPPPTGRSGASRSRWRRGRGRPAQSQRAGQRARRRAPDWQVLVSRSSV